MTSHEGPNEPAAFPQMVPHRRSLVTGLVALFLGASAVEIATRRDDWPLSNFPMYSGIQGPHFARRSLVGVSRGTEFPIGPAMSRPLGGAQLRHALDRLRGKKSARALEIFKDNYDERKAAGKHAGPELSGLRIYEKAWRVRVDRPRAKASSQRVVARTVFLAPRLKRALELEAAERCGPPSPQPVGPGDVVLEAETATVSGAFEISEDTYAHAGAALSVVQEEGFYGTGAEPETYAELRFTADPGTYTVWLRGKSSGSAKEDSVSLQFDDDIGTKRSSRRDGFGNFRSAYPANAYAWSSMEPGTAASTVTFETAGEHRIRLSAPKRALRLDQVWLSRSQRWDPDFSNPVTAARREGDR